MGLEIQDKTIYSMLFADDQLLIAQDYEDLEYMTRKLIEEYDFGGLKLNIKKTKYNDIGGPPLWSSGQSFWLQIQRSRVRFPALPDFSE